ncbi:MAG: hypothetical protein JWO53_805 [Chlamydiia bacterium]|nr:hypothetical protein [Chlamydiia bacterium]
MESAQKLSQNIFLRVFSHCKKFYTTLRFDFLIKDLMKSRELLRSTLALLPVKNTDSFLENVTSLACHSFQNEKDAFLKAKIHIEVFKKEALLWQSKETGTFFISYLKNNELIHWQITTVKATDGKCQYVGKLVFEENGEYAVSELQVTIAPSLSKESEREKWLKTFVAACNEVIEKSCSQQLLLDEDDE